mgnify:FL=1|jgi:hypothetical protein
MLRKILVRVFASIRHRSSNNYRAASTFLFNVISNIIFIIFRKQYIENISGKTLITKKDKPLFLLLRYKFAHGDKNYGISNENHAVTLPLKSSNICNLQEVYYDVDYGKSTCYGNNKVINIIKDWNPDLIILSSYTPGRLHQPEFDFLKLIKSNANIPFINIWHDSIGSVLDESKLIKSPLIDLHVLLDSANLLNKAGNKDKYIRLWAPIDQTFFYNRKIDNRDISVSFLGSTSSYRDIRKPYLDYLLSNNIDLYFSGGQREELMSLEEYASILKRSKISINFSFSVDEQSQLKVRVFEILYSGSLLLESKNNETRKYFTPGVDYVEYVSKEDLLHKIRYYIAHEDERIKIALSGHKKATTIYSHNQFWKKIVDRLSKNNILEI